MNITLVIPSRNNLEYVQFAYNSIRTHIGKDTEIILMDDASIDGTWEWMQSLFDTDDKLKLYKNWALTRIGHTVLYNIGANLASNEIFGIFHADMIATPNYLTNMMKHVKPGVVVSATRIEPPLHPPGPEKIVENFGLEPEEFNMNGFLKFVEINESINKDKTTPGIFAPWIMYVSDFLAIGGHDKRLFAPMELEDSDLFNRFLLKGYTFIQARDAFVYHMTCRGSRFKDGIKITSKIPVGNGNIWNKAQDSTEYTELRNIKFREWWRKWHMNVLHDELMQPTVCKRYDVGYIIHNTSEALLNVLEPWCDTIYTDLPTNIIDAYIKKEITTSAFDIANRINPITADKTNNILIEFNDKQFTTKHFEFISNLMFIIQDSGEIGEFEHDIFKINIKSLDSYENQLIHADDQWLVNQLR